MIRSGEGISDLLFTVGKPPFIESRGSLSDLGHLDCNSQLKKAASCKSREMGLAARRRSFVDSFARERRIAAEQ